MWWWRCCLCALFFYARERPTPQSRPSRVLPPSPPPPRPLCGTLDTRLHRVLSTDDVVETSASKDIPLPVLRVFLRSFLLRASFFAGAVVRPLVEWFFMPSFVGGQRALTVRVTQSSVGVVMMMGFIECGTRLWNARQGVSEPVASNWTRRVAGECVHRELLPHDGLLAFYDREVGVSRCFLLCVQASILLVCRRSLAAFKVHTKNMQQIRTR